MTYPPAPALPLLDELRAKATTGPWEVRWQCPEESHHHDWDEGWIADPEGATVASLNERYTSGTEDAALIVAAVNRLPDLTAALRAVLTEHDGRTCCDRTFESLRGYEPCPTVAAITTALEAS